MPGAFSFKIICCCLQILFLAPALTAFASDGIIPSEYTWQILQTINTTINYQEENDLKKMAAALDYEPESWYLQNLLNKKSRESPRQELIRKIDDIFKRVREILDMRPKMKKVQILVFGSKQDLQEQYRKRFSKTKHIRAWYIFKENTIYINIDDMHEGIMAHEMAHAIIDHYFEIKPPSATAEILARYVDKHLVR